ncbi:hypothetical protein SAY87_019633 [Trapa incisa]|uniref:Uncharacterized protein n=1 Tax=Trapa incisa TaxID=236973 RepID=A0AAN7K5N2_9MYRT|nr:hypothetical protein SAY87_019633 [Trapa incisa]
MMILRSQRLFISLSNKNAYLHPQKPFSIYSSVLFFSTSEPKISGFAVSISDYLTNRHNLSPETALKVSKYRNHLMDPGKADSVIDFLKDVGFSKTHFESVLQRVPFLLFSNVETMRPKIKVFQDAGICPSDIVKIISRDPWIFTRSADNRLLPSITALKSVVRSSADLSKILKLCAWFLRTDPDKTLIPNVEMMKSCGVTSRQIAQYILSFPRLFLVKPDRLKGFIDRVDGMRVDRGSLVFLSAIRTVSSMSPERWEQKLGAFRSLGFSDEDMVSIFRKVPQALTISEKKLKEVSKVLLETGEADTAHLVSRPELLMLSAERRLKPRLLVMKTLESKNLLERKPNLNTTCKISEKMFLNKYVFPYLDVVGDAYVAATASKQSSD